MKKPDLTLKGLRAWLGRQKINREYQYLDHTNCLMCRFLRSQGFKKVRAYFNVVEINGKSWRLPDRLNKVALYSPHSYFAARDRAAR